MYKKACVKIFFFPLIFVFFGFIAFCTVPKVELPSVPSPQDEPNKLEYKFQNGQVFLKIHLTPPAGAKTDPLREEWALLDSSATENLMVDLEDQYIAEISWQKGKHSIQQTFYSLGSASPDKYRLILGQPFFRSNCIIMNLGVPELIEPHNKKRCPIKSNESWYWFRLTPGKGQLLLPVKVGNIAFDVSVDTGSAMTALPKPKLESHLVASEKRVKALLTFGKWKEQIVYQLKVPIRIPHIQGDLEFNIPEILDSESLWEENYDYFPTLGMDFFRTFRVYIDLGSKSIGIEDHGKQR